MTEEKYDSAKDTELHMLEVQIAMERLIVELDERWKIHDKSKLSPEEKPTFDEVTPRLKRLTYGSDGYKESLATMGKALEHHYKVNRHHPEHFDHGVSDMNLVDVVEMFCDWCAATKRHADGDIGKSIANNARRFGFGWELARILANTAEDLELGLGHAGARSHVVLGNGGEKED